MAADPLSRRLPAVRPRGLAAWVMGALFAAAGGVALFSPELGAGPRFPVEATYLAQAESLARDLDRVWGDEDRRRQPSGRVEPLVRGGEESIFSRPPVYSLYLAPFVLVGGMRGAALANLALLALATLVAFRIVYRRLGDSATWLLTLAVFASVLWVDVYLAQPEILLLTASVCAFALAYGREEPAKEHLEEIYRGEVPGGARPLLRWASIGALLALPILHHPLYLMLLVPAGAAIPAERRNTNLAVLLAAALSIALLFSVIDWVPGDSWLPASWEEVAGGGVSSAFESSFDAKVQSWNLVYLLAGRNVGVLPYFLPVLVLFGAWKGGTGRSTLMAVALLTLLLLPLLDPFNFFGGPGAVGNRWFVPLYGALWFVPTRPVSRSLMGLAALAAAAFVWPLWLPPSGSPVDSVGRYRHSSGRVSSWLPYETTQQQLVNGGESTRGRLWARAVSGSSVVDPDRSEFELAREGRTELLIAVPLQLIALYLEFDSPAEPQMEVQRGELEGMVFRPNGRVGFNLRPPSPRRHRLWWSREDQYLYLFEFRLSEFGRGAIRYTVTGLTVEWEPSSG